MRLGVCVCHRVQGAAHRVCRRPHVFRLPLARCSVRPLCCVPPACTPAPGFSTLEPSVGDRQWVTQAGSGPGT